MGWLGSVGLNGAALSLLLGLGSPVGFRAHRRVAGRLHRLATQGQPHLLCLERSCLVHDIRYTGNRFVLVQQTVLAERLAAHAVNLYKLIWNIMRSAMEGTTVAFFRLLVLLIFLIGAAVVVVAATRLHIG